MNWLTLIAALIAAAASLYSAYNSYVSRHEAATSARIAKHAAKEAGEERRVASKAARVAVAASGTQDPGTAMDQGRVSGEPEAPPVHSWREVREQFTTPSGVRVRNDPTPFPREASEERAATPRVLAHDGTQIGWSVPPEVADAGYAPPFYREEYENQARPASTHLVPSALADQYAQGGPSLLDSLAPETYRAMLMSAADIARHNDEVAGADPTQSGAQSWPTGSAPEDPSRNGGENSPGRPDASRGTGGGDTWPDNRSGSAEATSPAWTDPTSDDDE